LAGIVVSLAIVGIVGWQLLASYLNVREWQNTRQKGEAATEIGDLAGAEIELERSLESARKMDPQDPRLDESLLKLGDVREAQGKYQDTEYLYMQALQNRVSKFGAVSQPTAQMQARLGHVLRLQNEPALLQRLFRWVFQG
jgi:tetratricopeptide (TPR) repeat protein